MIATLNPPKSKADPVRPEVVDVGPQELVSIVPKPAVDETKPFKWSIEQYRELKAKTFDWEAQQFVGHHAEELIAALEACAEAMRRTIRMLERAHSGYIPGCRDDMDWEASRDVEVADNNAILARIDGGRK